MIEQDLRERILAAPEHVIDDRDVMLALVAATERARGENVVDLRGVFMQRLQRRLERLEDTHRSVIAAAYENLAGTKQIQKAVLQLLEPSGFDALLAALAGPVADTLALDDLRLVLESRYRDESVDLHGYEDVVMVVEPGFVKAYAATPDRRASREVILRHIGAKGIMIYGGRTAHLTSEALLKLDLGPGRLPAMLVLASRDPHQFRPNQGTDLLSFFAATFQLTMRRWLQ